MMIAIAVAIPRMDVYAGLVSTPVVTNHILTEGGDGILTEAGDKLTKEG